MMGRTISIPVQTEPGTQPGIQRFGRLPIQPQLIVSVDKDQYEQEADAVAERVVADGPALRGVAPVASDPSVLLQRKCAECAEKEEDQPIVQRQPDEEEEKEREIAPMQRLAADGVSSPAPPGLGSRLAATRGSGRSLPVETRTFMESGIGADFSGVRIHTGGEAAALNRELRAHAFTHGSDIYFNAGKFAPETTEGQRLLAHELTHVVQQRGNVLQAKIIRRQPAPATSSPGLETAPPRPASAGNLLDALSLVSSFFDSMSHFYSVATIDQARLDRVLTSNLRTVDEWSGIIRTQLGDEAALHLRLRQSYTTALRAIMLRASIQLNKPLLRLYLEKMPLIPAWAWPDQSAFPLSNESQRRAFIQSATDALGNLNTLAGYATLTDTVLADILSRLRTLADSVNQMIETQFGNDRDMHEQFRVSMHVTLAELQRRAASSADATSFGLLWRQFEQHQVAGRGAEALAAALDLSNRFVMPNAEERALELAVYLFGNNQAEAALRVLSGMERFQWIRSQTHRGPVQGFLDTHHFGQLRQQGLSMARSGNTTAAYQTLSLEVFQILVTIQIQTSNRHSHLRAESVRLNDLLTAAEALPPGRERRQAHERANYVGALPNMIRRIFNYGDLGGLYSRLRQSVSIFSSLQREAILSGDTAEAARFALMQQEFTQYLRDHHLIQPAAMGMTLESSQTTNSRGETGYAVHGANDREEIVTPLPGTATPAELGRFPAYAYMTEELTDDIVGQETLVNDLLMLAEVRRAFPDGRIALNDQTVRIRVWTLVFNALRLRDPATAMEQLIRMMERYLRHFTAHSGYNIRDFGTSYIASHFPEDLTGRVLRDCGVYALTTAYELYRVGRAATPRLDLSFELFTMPEHVALAILDRAANNHYVLNNDRISGPTAGADMVGSVGEAYATTFNRGFAMAPSVSLTLGDTSQGDRTFRDAAWERYQAATGWGLAPEEPTSSSDMRSESERAYDAYRHYYEALPVFDRYVSMLHGAMNRLADELGQQPAASRQAWLDAQLNSTSFNTAVMSLSQLFIRYGPGARVVVSPSMPRAQQRLMLGRTASFLFSMRSGAGSHPLVRYGKALLLLQHLGGTLTADQQTTLTALRRAPRFDADLRAFETAQFPVSF